MHVPHAQGNQCPYAHGVYERNLHPSKYRTQLCTEGERCSRRVCFFAHSHQQLRMPVGAWSLEEAVRARTSELGIRPFNPKNPGLLCRACVQAHPHAGGRLPA